MNPSPAILTSPFTARIGNDTTVSDQTGSVILTPGVFSSLTINFDPSTVNTTSNMVITATLGNSVPQSGSIIVTFPS